MRPAAKQANHILNIVLAAVWSGYRVVEAVLGMKAYKPNLPAEFPTDMSIKTSGCAMVGGN
jgi:hypothetical protein